MVARPQTTDSSSPVRAAARAREPSYPCQDSGPSGLKSLTGEASSLNSPSATRAMASRAVRRSVIAVPQGPLQDLAHVVAGQGVQEVHDAGALVRGEAEIGR